MFSTVSAVYGIMKDAKLTRQLTDLNKQRVRQVKREEKVLLRLKHMYIYHEIYVEFDVRTLIDTRSNACIL